MSSPPTPFALFNHPTATEVNLALMEVIRQAPVGSQRRALLFRAHAAATVLAKAICQIADPAEQTADLEQAERVAMAAHAALSGSAELVARIALIERIAFTSNVVADRGRDTLDARAAGALEAFRFEWPDFGEALTASDFATAVEKWTARSGKWPYLVKLMRKAGMAPPTARTLLTEWSRHIARRRAHSWSWDGARWVSSPRRARG